MNVERTIEVCSAIACLKNILEKNSNYLCVGHDFNEFYKVVSDVDRDITEHFSPKFNTLLPGQSFWIILRDRDHNPISTVASRLEVLEHGHNVSRYLKEYLPRVYRAADGRPVRLSERQASFCEEASGRVVYLGEAWAALSARRLGVTGNMVKLVQLLSLVQFEPDFLYCWIRPAHAKTGFPQACGYKEVFKRAIRWELEPQLPDNDPDKSLGNLWLAGNRRGGLEDLADDVLAEYGSL